MYSSTSVGFRPSAVNSRTRYSISSGASDNPNVPVRVRNRLRSPAEHIDVHHRLRRVLGKHGIHQRGLRAEYAFCHAIVQHRTQPHQIARTLNPHHTRTLNLRDLRKARIVQNVSGFARPRRLRPGTRRNPKTRSRSELIPLAQQLTQPRLR